MANNVASIAGVTAAIDVREIRKSLGLSQEQFSKRFGFNLYSVRNWEQGKCRPPDSCRALLAVISAAPSIVEEAIKSLHPG
jgi:putative transcriptional regulator